jgi:ectoine hydroxylase-related dioxygenase (phytanoyl-CoA dioxygenase family)
MVEFDDLNHDSALNILNGKTPESILEYYNESYNVPQDKIDFYKKNGFVVLKKVLNGFPLSHAKKVIRSAVLLRKESDKRTLAEKTPYEQSFLQCGFLCWDFPAVKDYVFGKRFAGIAKQLMEADGARLWHDQALFKESKGRHTPVHQDSSYWPVKNPEQTTTMWMALSKASIKNGCLYFYPGSQKWEREYVDIFNNPHEPDKVKENKKIYTPLNEGDVTFHSGLTFHGTDSNQTFNMREGMTVIYIADGNRFDSSDERNSTHKSCEGLKDNDIINTNYTPKLI